MNKFLFPGILILLAAVSLPEGLCSCQTALESDVPHGANETIEYSEKRVQRISGRVAYWNDGKPFADAVVEIYEIPRADRKLGPYEIVRRNRRRAACITSKDGDFCFPDLPSGRYVVRAGARSREAGMNEVFMKVNVDRSWWSRWFKPDKKIRLELTAGT